MGSPGGQVARIAVLRCNALGDYFMATPALAALRRRFPHAEITLLAGRWHAEFLSGRPSPVDRVLVVPHVAGLQGQPAGAPSQHALSRFLADARDYRYDLAVQLHGGGATSNPLVGALGARRSIGLQADGAANLDDTVPYRYYQSEVFRFLEVVAIVGAHGPPEYPELAVSGRERATAAALLPPGGPHVALHAGAGDPRRRWAPQRFAAVADGLAAAGARPVLVGSPADEPVSAAVRRHARTAPVDLTGRTDLGTLAAVLGRCAAVVANDSGPLHMARAVGVPTVELYWCGNAINAAPLSRTRHRPLLSWTIHCPTCGTDTSTAGFPHRPGQGCQHQPSFLDQIPVPEVLDEVLDLLTHNTSSPPEHRHDSQRSSWEMAGSPRVVSFET